MVVAFSVEAVAALVSHCPTLPMSNCNDILGCDSFGDVGPARLLLITPQTS